MIHGRQPDEQPDGRRGRACETPAFACPATKTRTLTIGAATAPMMEQQGSIMAQKTSHSGKSAGGAETDRSAILYAPRRGVRNGNLIAETAVASMLETGTLVASFGGVALKAGEINLAIDREGLLYQRIATPCDEGDLYLLVFHDGSCLVGRRVAKQNTHSTATGSTATGSTATGSTATGSAASIDWAANDVIQIDTNAMRIARTLTIAKDDPAETQEIKIAVRMIRRRGGRYLRLGATTQEADGDHWSSIIQPFGSDIVSRIRTKLYDEIKACAIGSTPALSREAGAASSDAADQAADQNETSVAAWPAYMTRRPGESGVVWPAVELTGATMSANNALEAGILLRAIIQARVGLPIPDPASHTGQSIVEPSAISEIRLVAGTGPHTIRSLRRPAGFVDIKAPGANRDAVKALSAAIEDDLSGWLDLSRLQGWDYTQTRNETKVQRRIKRCLELEVIVSLDRIAAMVAEATMHERIATLRAIQQVKAARKQTDAPSMSAQGLSAQDGADG